MCHICDGILFSHLNEIMRLKKKMTEPKRHCVKLIKTRHKMTKTASLPSHIGILWTDFIEIE